MQHDIVTGIFVAFLPQVESEEDEGLGNGEEECEEDRDVEEEEEEEEEEEVVVVEEDEQVEEEEEEEQEEDEAEDDDEEEEQYEEQVRRARSFCSLRVWQHARPRSWTLIVEQRRKRKFPTAATMKHAFT